MRFDIKELFDLIFKYDKLQFCNKDIQNKEQLIKENILIKEGNFLTVNLKTDLIFEYLISYAESILNLKFPSEISDSLLFCQSFHEEIKKINNAPFANSYNIIIENFAAFVLAKRNSNGKEITQFLLNLTEEGRDQEKHLYDYEKHYYNAQLKLETDKETISKAIKHSINDEIHRFYTTQYANQICEKKPIFANELVEYWRGDEFDLSFKYLQKIILSNLYKQDHTIFKKAFEVFEIHPKILINFLADIDYQNDDDLKTAITFVEKIELENNLCGSEIVQFYGKLLKIKSDSEEIKNKVFEKLYEYFDKNDENIRGWIIHILIRDIDGFEYERYNFLHHILNTTKNIRIIEHYFDKFKDPKYYFHLFQFAYSKLEFRTNLSLFKYGIRNFWKTNRIETEKYILEFLSTESIILRLGGIHLLLMGIFPINALNVDSEIGQLRTIEGFERFPHSIEKTVPFLLQLRNSNYKSVKEECRLTLGRLIFEAYHEYIYNIIVSQLTNSNSDKKLKKYFTQILDSYNKMCEFKGKINDLSPHHNESNLMDLYYRLEHENQAKMMEEIKDGKGTFLEHLGKTNVIVRGNAWKSDGQDNVGALTGHQYSVYLDGRTYKNPDLYEYILNSDKSKYDN
ncbi:hypothetical protein SAMN05421786_101275 [Chryseobacterium ureilyticum]|uniref:Uncharacterized protein n=1 Tax=Chryseobacterium ureilyticum TaxID=373668 RepID=A0A1N7K6X6_9FLAO|nr:hypothetical protein [Chryseobacterium ureilyticum]SIS57288.1 hypothetical protein SAMN05421786_101275 [Chryseobacterium ureilyticum]